MITSMSGPGKYRVRHRITLRNMLVSDVWTLRHYDVITKPASLFQVSGLEVPELDNAFCIAERGVPKPYRFTSRYISLYIILYITAYNIIYHCI